MSWSTLVMGSFRFNYGVLPDDRQRFIKLLSELIETDQIERDDRFREYTFCKVNPLCHVSGEKIAHFIEMNKSLLKYCSIDVYYLDDLPHDGIYMEDGRLTKKILSPFGEELDEEEWKV